MQIFPHRIDYESELGGSDGSPLDRVIYRECENKRNHVSAYPEGELCRLCGAHLANWKEMLHEEHYCPAVVKKREGIVGKFIF